MAPPGGAAAGRPAVGDVDAALAQMELGERNRTAEIAAAQERIDEIVTWGDVGTNRRPATPSRNAMPLPRATATAGVCWT